MSATLGLLYLLLIPHLQPLEEPRKHLPEFRGPFFRDAPIYYDIPQQGFPFRR